jgi:hypothetical protein
VFISAAAIPDTRVTGASSLSLYLPKFDIPLSSPPTFSPPVVWNDKTANRFRQLVVKEALGTATAKEVKEREILSRIRRVALVKLNPEDVVRDYARRQRTRDLLEALKRCVELDQRPSAAASGSA